MSPTASSSPSASAAASARLRTSARRCWRARTRCRSTARRSADPDLINEGAWGFGSQCIVVAIDPKWIDGHWEVFINGGRIPTGKDALDWAREVEERGAGEILLTSMDRDGTKAGYNLELTRAVAEAVSIPVIASGGAGTMAHFCEALTSAKPMRRWRRRCSTTTKSASATSRISGEIRACPCALTADGRRDDVELSIDAQMGRARADPGGRAGCRNPAGVDGRLHERRIAAADAGQRAKRSSGAAAGANSGTKAQPPAISSASAKFMSIATPIRC